MPPIKEGRRAGIPATLSAISVVSPSGRVRNRPACLVADRSYNNRPFSHNLKQRGVRACIPVKRRPISWKPHRGRPVSHDRLLDLAR